MRACKHAMWPCVDSKLRNHPPHLWGLLLPARSPPAFKHGQAATSTLKWASFNSSPSLFIIESVLSIFIRFIWIFKLLSINKNHAQLLPNAGDRALDRTSISERRVFFPIAGWNQVIFEFSSNSKSAIFKPLWIDASGVLPSFQSCFFASFTSSFLTAVELKKKYEYNKYMICPFQGADTPDVQFIHSKLLLHSVFSRNWLNMFYLVSYLVSMKPSNSAWHAISCRDPCVSGRQPGTNYVLKQPMSAPQNPGLCSLTLSCFPRSLFSKSLGRLRKWFK